MHTHDLQFLRSFASLIILYSAVTFSAGLLGVFYIPLIIGAFVCASALLYRQKLIFRDVQISHWLKLLLTLTAGFSILVAIVSEPSVFSGRDEGALAGAAQLMSAYHGPLADVKVAHTFFESYGPGKALHFPGFHYTHEGQLVSQFPLPYVTFLAGFYSVLGLHGLVMANALLLFIFIIYTTVLARILTHLATHSIRSGSVTSATDTRDRVASHATVSRGDHRHNSESFHIILSWWFYALLLSTFSVSWFAKFTLSENLAGALLWISFFLFFSRATPLSDAPGDQNPSVSTSSRAQIFPIVLFLTSLTLLFFTRIEGMWIAPALLVLAFYTHTNVSTSRGAAQNLNATTLRKILPQLQTVALVGSATLFIGLFCLNLLYAVAFYKTLISALLPQTILDFFQRALANTPDIVPEESALSAQDLLEIASDSPTSISWITGLTDFYVPIFSGYGLLIPLLATIAFALYCLITHLRSHKPFTQLHPFLIIMLSLLPLFLYYLDPQISPDHPWMLRRFTWALLPATLLGLVLCAQVIASKISTKKRIENLHTSITPKTTFIRYAISLYRDPVYKARLNISVILLIILIANVVHTLPYLTYTPHAALLNQTADVSTLFAPGDLILVSPEVTSDGFAMIDAPLRNSFGLDAVYFYAAQDLQRIDVNPYNRVYLIAPSDGEIDFSAITAHATLSAEFTLSIDRLQDTRGDFNSVTSTTTLQTPPKRITLNQNNFVWRIQ